MAMPMPMSYNDSCVYGIDSKGLFYGDEPLHYASPLMLLELFVASTMTILVSLLLKPLGIPEMISQIIAGTLLCPTILGQIKGFQAIFPARHYTFMALLGDLGSIFQFFLMGIEVNPAILRTAGRREIIIGTTVLVIPMIFSFSAANFLKIVFRKPQKAYRSLITVGITESLNAFPVIICYLTELNFLNLEFSRLAISSSMISYILYFAGIYTLRIIETTSNFIGTNSTKKGRKLVPTLASYAFVVVVVLFIIRPVVRWIVKMSREGKKLNEQYLCPLFIVTLMLGWFCYVTKIYIPFGPLLFGMIIPSGSLLGSALVERLEFFNKWIIMPVFYTVYGASSINVFALDIQVVFQVGFVVVASYAGKFLGAYLPARYYNMSYKDSSLLGLAMNAQGFVELTNFRYLIANELVSKGSVEVMCASMLLANSGMTPIIRYLYKSSMEEKLQSKRTIQHSEPNSVLRFLACVYDIDNVPPVIHLIKATNPTKENPVSASIIHFVELVGHATPLIVSHKNKRKNCPTMKISERVITVFKRYEETDRQSISLHPYTVVSPYSSLHDDVCTIALQKWTSFIILPFHKQLDTGVVNPGIRTVNCNVLDKAPCSVGILIDRGIHGGTNFIFENWSSYRVAMFFLGGPDDREALALGTRMSTEPTIEFTVIRLLPSSTEDGEMFEKGLDDEMVSEFKLRTYHNNKVTYSEVKVEDGFGIIKLIECMQNKYELILLGRRHNQNSPLILGLTDWNKCSEIGTIGDIFTTSTHADESTILVVQQQRTIADSWDIMLDDDEKPVYDC